MSNFSQGNLYPYPAVANWKGGYAEFKYKSVLVLSNNLKDETISFFHESWANFTRNQVTLEIKSSPDKPVNSFLLATSSTMPPDVRLNNNAQTALEVSPEGAGGIGVCEQDLKYAWISMLQLLVCGRGESTGNWLLPAISIQDKSKLEFRGIHLCVFPETSLDFIDKIVMLAAFYKYSHIVIEFWGMLKFDCLEELSWPNAFSKKQVDLVLKKARRMGIEPIPMFNHWGHASAGRVSFGKHVILDQNPNLEPLFEPDGWTWCLTNPDTLNLLSEIRSELRELFGNTKFFHMGCDESYSHGSCPECLKHDSPKLLGNYLNMVNDDLKQYGTRPIIWGDALLADDGKWEGYIALSRKDQRTHEAIDMLSKDFIINDWQYRVNDKDNDATLKHFMEHGFDVITAPWDKHQNIKALADMAIENNAMGMMLTTWDTLPNTLGGMPIASDCMWGGSEFADILRHGGNRMTSMATFLRKLRGTTADYRNSGWCEEQV